MKILELHLRNIASIEKADIDFENDLKDNITGDGANIFLISGDTGTGKSVILDGISMALYKKTPRIEGVANKTNNDYTDNKGESISINSIEQYTRLGISEKDECYSELIFEGNDHKKYHARLKLGMSKSRSKDKNGNYLLKHSTPVWEVKAEGDDWQKVEAKAKSGQPVLDCVGLNFEQFGRMAMLAQGQFASFLTGKKDEREKILEQLTNTEKFSLYGDAISNIFTNAKAGKALAQTTYDTEKGHVLPTDELQTLNDDLAKLTADKEHLEQEHKKQKAALDTVTDIYENINNRSIAETQKKNLEEIVRSDTYIANKALVADWDSTNNERRLLAENKQAEQEKATALQHLADAKQTFLTLSADLLFRQNTINSSRQETAVIQAWVDERKSLDTVYSKADAIILQLRQYNDTCTKLQKTDSSLSTEKSKTVALTDSVKKWTAQVQQATQAVNAKQASIDALTRERQLLNPNQLNEEIKALNTKATDLGLLKERATKADEKHISLAKTKAEIDIETAQLDSLKDTYNAAQQAYQEAETKEDATHSLLTTMQMSVEQTITELRQRLKKNHADTCPLCGSTIDPQHLKDDFQHIISPIQQREEEAKAILKSATANRDNAKSRYDTFNGALKTKKSTYDKDLIAADSESKAIADEAARLALTPSLPLLEQITAGIGSVTSDIKTIETKQNQAEELQDRINILIKEKEPLDNALDNANTEQLKASNALDQNSSNIKKLQDDLLEYHKVKDALSTELSTMLHDAYPLWATDTANVITRLKTDANDYSTKKKELDDQTKAIEKAEALLSTIMATQAAIISTSSMGKQPIEPQEHKSRDINIEWTKLLSDINHQTSELNTANLNIEASTKALNTYYTTSGKTEQSLTAIIQSESMIADARKFVVDTDASLKSHNDAVNIFTQKINELLQSLSIDSIDNIPAKEPLADKVAELNNLIQTIIGNIYAINTQIQANNSNVEKFKQAEQTLVEANAIFEKWHRINSIFGGSRFRTLVQTYILRPLLNNANIYLEKITDRYTLTCSEDNDQLAILVLDRYNKNQIRSVTVLSGGERFMISLALSLALSSLNREDMNVNILFIDEGFGTLDENNLNSVMETLEKLQEIAGQSNRRVGIISHREELADRIPVKIQLHKKGEGRTHIEIKNE